MLDDVTEWMRKGDQARSKFLDICSRYCCGCTAMMIFLKGLCNERTVIAMEIKICCWVSVVSLELVMRGGLHTHKRGDRVPVPNRNNTLLYT